RAGRNGTERRAAEEDHLDVFREAMKAEEPSLAFGPVEGRIPFDRLAHAGDGALNDRVEPAPDIAFPAGHGRDIGLDGAVALALRDLRIAAREEDGLPGIVPGLAGPRPGGLLRRLDGWIV